MPSRLVDLVKWYINPPRGARDWGVSRGLPSLPSMIQGIERPWVTRMTSGEMPTSPPFLSATRTNKGGPGG
eukprot:35911-Alexandrium_andersonii.AAC.1